MSLFWKLFASIGLAMVITLVATVYVSYEIASSTFDQANIEGREPVIQEAAEALAANGAAGLRQWLQTYTREAPRNLVLLIVDENGRELLGRAVPREVRRLLDIRSPRRGRDDDDRRNGRDDDDDDDRGRRDEDDDDDDDRDGRGGRDDDDRDRDGFGFRGGVRPPNLRPAQLAPDLVGPAGEAYRLVFTRPLFTVFGFLTWPGTRVAVAAIAILIAAVTSLLLARYISAPIVRLQRASRALAAGVLETRVGSPSDRRADEVGTLARDFDTMAERIQALVTDKETLLRDISHELRSPLARMRMALALAQRRANLEAQPNLSRIETEAERLDLLIERIMTLARLRTQEAPQREKLEVEALVRSIVDDARFEYPDARIDFDTEGPTEMLADRAGLTSAIENVVRNAAIYAGDQSPIEIRLEGSSDGIVLRVRDSGPGVDEAALTRIFEPLYRVDESRDHKTAGHGIGLAITARVVELHGGEVSAANRAGGGLEVTLRLPADEA